MTATGFILFGIGATVLVMVCVVLKLMLFASLLLAWPTFMLTTAVFGST